MSIHSPKRAQRAKTRQEIADEYGIHRNSLRAKLKQADIDLHKGLLW